MNATIEILKAKSRKAVESYSSSYYEKLRSSGRNSARVIVPIVLELVDPKSVIDVGCGTGTWLATFAEHGIDDYLGVDGEYADRGLLEIPSSRFLPRDLRFPLRLDRTFDLAISLEVAEHLPEECSDIFV